MTCEDISTNMEVEEFASRRKRTRDDSSSEEGWTTVERGHKLAKKSLEREGDQSDFVEEKNQVSFFSKNPNPKLDRFKENNITHISRVKYVHQFRIHITLDKDASADKVLQCSAFADMGWKSRKTSEVNVSYGVIKDVDLDISNDELLKNISCEHEIVVAKRLDRRNHDFETSDDKGWLPSDTVRLGFKGQSLPAYVYIFGMRIMVEPYTFPVTQCSRCWQYGHSKNMCPSKKIVGPKCTANHELFESTCFLCINSKGAHISLDKSCTVYVKERKLRELIAEFNCAHRKALTMYAASVTPVRETSGIHDNVRVPSQEVYAESTPEIPSLPEVPRDTSSYTEVTQKTCSKEDASKVKPTPRIRTRSNKKKNQRPPTPTCKLNEEVSSSSEEIVEPLLPSERQTRAPTMPPNLSESLLPESPRIMAKLEKTRSVEKIGSIAKMEKTRSLESCVSIPMETCSCDEASYGDAVFSCLIVAPNVVSVWRGTWGIMELNPKLFPYAQIFLLGIVIHACFALVRAKLLARSAGAYSSAAGGAGCWLTERLLSRVYTYIFILSNIMHWRGGWGLLDQFIDTVLPDKQDPHRPVLLAALTLTFYATLTALRSSRNLLASPYFLVTDGKEPTYIFTTRFNMSNSRDTVLYILDCIFSVGVVGSLVVFVWRGSWALLDIFLFPDDQGKSCWTSLIVGYALVVVTFALQAPVRWAAARLHGAPRLLLADVYHLVSFVATVNVWRGVWGLLDIYFFPETPKLSNWSSHIISLTLLILLNCSNSVIVRGVYIDAEEPAGECVVFPCHYLRLFFHKERTKKRHRRALQAAAAAAARKPEDASLPLQMPEEKV